MAAGWDAGPTDQPIPPQNGAVVSPFIPGLLDIRWDDPSLLGGNSAFTVVGVNVYRSDGSDRGPYFRINEFPVGGTFYRDQTQNIPVTRELVTAEHWISRGDAPNDKRWVFRTRHPIVKVNDAAPFNNPTAGNTPSDVQVFIDNVEVPVESVFGVNGEVTLINQAVFNHETERNDPAKLPVAATSVIEITYHTNRNYVRSGLGTKLHYRLTTVVTDANVPGGYRETPVGYCPPLTPFAVERLDYIWREAIRRNHWILQQGGERVKVFIKKVAGLPCDCALDDRTREYSQQPSQKCHTCFVPGTLVRTGVGYKPIEFIREGEKVLAADGTYRSVVRTFEKSFTGDLVSLLPSVSARPILATPEHPFLVLRGAHQRQIQRACGPKCARYIEQGDGLNTTGSVRQLPSGNWWARVQVNGSRGSGRKALGTFATRPEAEQAIENYLSVQAEPGHVLKWDGAGAVSKGDWLVAKWSPEVVDLSEVAVPQEYRMDLSEVAVPQEYRKNTHFGQDRLGPDQFNLDQDFLWMVGLYLAEGCKSTRAINFCLHRDELDFQDRLVSLFSRWGFNPKVYPHSDPEVQSAVVSVGSTTLAEWFPAWLGDGCQNKKVPESLMRLPPAKLWALLRGLHDGDGSKRDREITQTSEVLALQIVEMLHRCGEHPLVRRQRSNTLTPKGNKRRLAFCVSWAEETLGRANRKGRWDFETQVLTQVRALKSVPYSGSVYNLEVEGDHSYVVQGVAVHNCFGTGFVGGYEGPYDVIIAPDDAERRMAQRERGRRMEHSYEVFMSASPLVTQRDFIVKMTNERYAIGPVRRPSNRGNLLQQHFQIGYLDEGDVRYKFPIDGTTNYTWPETRYGYRQAPNLPVDGALPDTQPFPASTDAQLPMQTEKGGVTGATPDPVEQRGRSPVWENISS